MRRSRKIILITVLALAILAGSIGGVVYAQNQGEPNSATSDSNSLLARVATILQQEGVNIDQAQLQSAFTQAEQDMKNEAQDKYLQGLVDDGKITQDQADQYKAWLNSKPNVPLAPGFGGGMHRGFGGSFGGFRGWCAPQLAPQVTPQTTQ